MQPGLAVGKFVPFRGRIPGTIENLMGPMESMNRWMYTCGCGYQFATKEELREHPRTPHCGCYEVVPRVVELPHYSILEQLGRWEIERLLRSSLR